MILGCPQCRTRFRIDDTKVRSDGVKVRCSRCAHVFWATPEQGEPEVGATTSTRRVDAAALIALALESDPDAAGAREPDLAAPAPSPAPSSNPTQELPLSEGDPGLIDGLDEADLFFPVQDQGPPPDLDEVRGALEASGDLFDALDRAAEPPEPFDAPHDELLDGPGARFDPSDAFGAPSAGDASAFPPAQIPDALRGASVDLPPAAPPTSSFLDDGSARPSTDLELAEALESDFFSERALPVPEMASAGPGAAGSPDLLDEGPPSSVPLGRLALVRADAADDDEDRTRVAEASEMSLPAPPPPPARRGPSRWPTWVGLVLGLAVSATFVPGWAPAPLDAVAPRVAELVHPAATLRLPDALPDVRTEGAEAFPYPVGGRTVVVVRGRSVNVGSEPRRGVRATVLLLDDDVEVGRASAPVGVVPDAAQLARQVAAGADARPLRPQGDAAVLEPGESAPFLVVLTDVAEAAHRMRFRVEMEAAPEPAAPRRGAKRGRQPRRGGTTVRP